jgi:hypothetical protein
MFDDNFLTSENIQKFSEKYAPLVEKIKKTAQELQGQDIAEVTKIYTQMGFRCVVRLDDEDGINPYFDPKKIILYHQDGKFCDFHYI